ncbi:MAG: protein-export chaperone SecB [Acetobacteraceae bacterium]|nr:protein-export chaperone SecB [Acetobacteraceae bacterium]
MADSPAPTPGPTPTPTGPQALPLVQNALYVKDLSFEVPGAPEIYMSMRSQPQIQLKLDVQARRANEQNLFEVVLTIGATAKVQTQAGNGPEAEATAFVAELVYGGLWTLNAIPTEAMERVLLVDCPALMFPFARAIIADVTRDGGFPPVLLAPIDFLGLFEQRRAQPSGTA